MASITLVPIDFERQRHLLPDVAEALQRTFHCPVRQIEAPVDLEAAFDPSRGQYNSTRLLAELLRLSVDGEDRILGVTSLDLFIPILTFVFGEAQLEGRAALVSTYRMQNEVYGMEPHEGQLRERLRKEALHELGHVYGLVHCSHPRCVMRSATYVEHIDLKEGTFCAPCQERLQVIR